MKTDVHFPTDINLLWDAARKSIEISCFLANQQKLPGWRKASEWKKKVESESRILQKVKSSGGKNKEGRLHYATNEYLNLVKKLDKKAAEFIAIFTPSTVSQELKVVELKYFKSML